MKLLHPHDITKYSTRIVINDVITILKWRTAAILDFWKIEITRPGLIDLAQILYVGIK